MNRQPKSGTRFWQIEVWNICATTIICAVRYRVDGEAATVAGMEDAVGSGD